MSIFYDMGFILIGWYAYMLYRIVREVLEEHAHEVQKYQSLARAVEEANERR